MGVHGVQKWQLLLTLFAFAFHACVGFERFENFYHPPLNEEHIANCPKDGYIDESEMTHRNLLHLNLEIMDRNLDGKISGREAIRFSMHRRTTDEASQNSLLGHLKGETPPSPFPEEKETLYDPPAFQMHFSDEYPDSPGSFRAHEMARNDIVMYDSNADGRLDKEEYAAIQRREEWELSELRNTHQQMSHRHFENLHSGAMDEWAGGSNSESWRVPRGVSETEL